MRIWHVATRSSVWDRGRSCDKAEEEGGGEGSEADLEMDPRVVKALNLLLGLVWLMDGSRRLHRESGSAGFVERITAGRLDVHVTDVRFW